MFGNPNLPHVVRVRSTVPVTDELEAFDMMSRFLAAEKAKQLSHDFEGQAYLGSSSQTWNDLRLACNSLLDHNDPRREPVALWREQIESAALSETETPTTPMSIKKEPTLKKEDVITVNTKKATSEKKAKKSAKKAKKEEKKVKKAAKKAKKEKERKNKAEA